MSKISGYPPVSRIGKIVMNAYEFAALKDQLTGQQMTDPRGAGDAKNRARGKGRGGG